MCTLIPTVYRALLKSALSGIGHRFTSLRKSILALEVRTRIEYWGLRFAIVGLHAHLSLSLRANALIESCDALEPRACIAVSTYPGSAAEYYCQRRPDRQGQSPKTT